MTDETLPSSSQTQLAEFIFRPTTQAAALCEDYNVLGVGGQAGYQAMADRLQTIADQINKGDQTHLKTLLVAQLTVLDTLFGQLCRRALVNKYDSVHTHILGMALKAQRQSVSTMGALAQLMGHPSQVVVQNNVHVTQQNLNVEATPPPALGEYIPPKITFVGEEDVFQHQNMTNELLVTGPN